MKAASSQERNWPDLMCSGVVSMTVHPSKAASFILVRSSTNPSPGMPAAGVDPTVDFDRNHVGRPGEVETPAALGVEYQLGCGVREADKLSQHLVVQGNDLLGLAHLIGGP